MGFIAAVNVTIILSLYFRFRLKDVRAREYLLMHIVSGFGEHGISQLLITYSPNGSFTVNRGARVTANRESEPRERSASMLARSPLPKYKSAALETLQQWACSPTL